MKKSIVVLLACTLFLLFVSSCDSNHAGESISNDPVITSEKNTSQDQPKQNSTYDNTPKNAISEEFANRLLTCLDEMTEEDLTEIGFQEITSRDEDYGKSFGLNFTEDNHAITSITVCKELNDEYGNQGQTEVVFDDFSSDGIISVTYRLMKSKTYICIFVKGSPISEWDSARLQNNLSDIFENRIPR